jgi:peptidoglycan/xylan/chitin deacetylase (PgdA/CDA1 family)
MRAILTYHSIDDSGSPISVAPATFRHHVEWLASGRVRVVSLEEITRLNDAVDAVAITFDDAFSNFADVAWPRLREYSLPVTLFVVPGHVGGTNAWSGRSDPRVPTLPLLDWIALGRLAEQGARIGAHTRTHPHLTQLDVAALTDELAGGAEDIRRELGRNPEEFAYPYGDTSPAVAAATGQVYRRAVTTELRTLATGDDPLNLPRLDSFYLQAPGRLESWGTPAFSSRLWVRARARWLRKSLPALGKSW